MPVSAFPTRADIGRRFRQLRFPAIRSGIYSGARSEDRQQRLVGCRGSSERALPGVRFSQLTTFHLADILAKLRFSHLLHCNAPQDKTDGA